MTSASLNKSHPTLSLEWHYSRNTPLKPENVTAGSNRKVWWKCSKGHEWVTSVAKRAGGTGCPFCSGLRATAETSLEKTNPRLASEWDYEKNAPLTPSAVKAGSGRKVWWKCAKSHAWQAEIVNRNGGNNCPYCSHQKILPECSLRAIHPEIARDWNYEKNCGITPDQVAPATPKRYWWKCNKNHEWQATVYSRSHGTGCPYCKNRRPWSENSLQKVNPTLSSEWHPTKNGKLTPSDVLPGSTKKVWWKCKNGHEWLDSLNHRSRGRGCPYCSGKRLTKGNSLQAVNPDMSAEWHPTKNGNLKPENLFPNSHRSVWWLCKRGHEWKAIIANRNRGRGCPFCNYSTSNIEIRIFCELKKIFNKVLLRENIDGVECDVYIPDLSLGIEYDGAYWHRNSYEKDSQKNENLREAGIDLIRIRGYGLARVSNYDLLEKEKESEISIVKRLV